eukprot:gene10663-7804_t
MALRDIEHLEVQDAFTGEYIPLHQIWSEKTVVLGFFRRFGCKLCRYAAVQLSTLQGFLDAAGARLVAVGFEAVGLQAFVNGKFFSGDIYVDLSRACYRGLKLENLGFLRGMAMLLTDTRVASTLKEAKDVAYGDFKGDGMQLGATFVVGPGCNVFLEHRQKHFGDNPNLDEVKKAVASAVQKSVNWIEIEMNLGTVDKTSAAFMQMGLPAAVQIPSYSYQPGSNAALASVSQQTQSGMQETTLSSFGLTNPSRSFLRTVPASNASSTATGTILGQKASSKLRLSRNDSSDEEEEILG